MHPTRNDAALFVLRAVATALPDLLGLNDADQSHSYPLLGVRRRVRAAGPAHEILHPRPTSGSDFTAALGAPDTRILAAFQTIAVHPQTHSVLDRAGEFSRQCLGTIGMHLPIAFQATHR
jgi:hypothetical protein